MKKEELLKLVEKAKSILEKNREGNFTKPSPRLYPHQYNWDSGFIAIGYSYYDEKKAQQELLSLFEGQWKNGMLPHIVYNRSRKTGEFPNREFWKISLSKDSTKLHTSGITQPPVHATACRIIYENSKDKKNSLVFLRKIFPKILKNHRYLYRERDPLKEGLVYIRHPWESGIDNSPLWDGIINTIQFDRKIIYRRTDIKHKIPLKQRPSNKEYDAYIRLVELFKKYRYSEKEIFKHCPFLVQDAFFNSLLNRANKDLLWMARKLNKPTKEIEQWIKKTSKSLKNKLWNPRTFTFDSFNLVSRRNIPSHSLSGFAPMFSKDCTSKQASKISGYIESGCFGGKKGVFQLTTYDLTKPEFRSYNYWRGPVWINMNWIIAKGLLNYGYEKRALTIIRDSLRLVMKTGFYEYFDPYTGSGYGSKNFSWSAALTIDIIHRYFL